MIILNLFVILLSGERSAFVMYFLFCFYLFIFLKIKLKIKFIILLATILFSSLIFLFSPTIYERLVTKTIYEISGKNNFNEKYYRKNELIVKDYFEKGCNPSNEDTKIGCKYEKTFLFFLQLIIIII